MQLALGIPEVTFLGIPSEWSFVNDITTSEATGASPHTHEYLMFKAKLRLIGKDISRLRYILTRLN